MNIRAHRSKEIWRSDVPPNDESVALSGSRTARSRWMRMIGFSALGIVLVWAVITTSFVAYLAEIAPESALALNESDPTALVRRMQDLIARVPQPQDKAVDRVAMLDAATKSEIRSMAEQVMVHDPLNARPFAILGRLSLSEKDDGKTETLMKATVRRSLRESESAYWLFTRSVEQQNYAAAVEYADVIFRARPQVVSQIMPAIGRIAESKEGSEQLKKALGENPPWRGYIFEYLPQHVTDARTPLDLLLSVKDSPNPPAANDLRSYIDFLVSKKFYELAYYTWLQFLPPEQLDSVGYLFNGGFQTTPSGLPFDWVWPAGTGVTTDIQGRLDQIGDRALSIEFGYGRVEFRGASQLTLLAPGRYRFQGKFQGNISARRGLLWRITCLDAPSTPIGESKPVLGGATTWRDFEFQFDVPTSGCRAQHVRLVHDARTESEQFVSGQIWYDELKISRRE